MGDVLKSLGLAFGQLSDAAVLRLLARSMAITLLIFVLLAAGLWWALDAVIEGWIIAYLPGDYSNAMSAIIAIALALLGGWLLFRVVALAVLQFFADEVVIAVERRHYPAASASAQKLPFQEDLVNSLRGVGRALLYNALAAPVALVLLFSAIGPAVVFLAVNAVLLGRELTEMAWLRHRPSPADAIPVASFERLLLGGAIAALMMVPFANLLAPIIGAAAGTHLVQKSRMKAK